MEGQASSHPQFHQRLWLPNMAPRQGLGLCTFIALMLIVTATLITRQQPSIGITWAPTEDNTGLLIRQTASSLSIAAGTRVIGLRAPGGPMVTLHNGMLVEDPDQYATYALYNAFFSGQERLMACYMNESIILIGEDGGEWTLPINRQRTLGRLPASFWILNLTASVCFLVGCGIWWYRRGTITGRLLAVTGLCYFLSILCLSVYGSREMVMDPTLFRILSAANHLFTLIWCYSLLLMLVIYPARMGGKVTFFTIYGLALVIWINQTLQWIEVPVHAYYGLTHIASYLFSIFLACLQWRRTTRQPVERASLRWFILSIFISIGVAALLFVLPAVNRNYGAIPLWVPAISVLLMFIGFSFGILRYGLFNLERYWFTGWVWLISGLLITGIDGMIVLIMDISFQKLLPYSILLLGWIYFPLRHWLWRLLVKPETYRIEYHLSILIRSLMESGSIQSFIDRWSGLLKQVFNPLEIIIVRNAGKAVCIRQHGLAIQVPGLENGYAFRLIGNRLGTRLFDQRDADLSQGLLALSQAIYCITNQTRKVQDQGAAKERERIMRDLHDDVLPKLITIKQQSPTVAIASMAEAAFQSIRETIYILRYPSDQPLEDALADWRGELAERLMPTGLKLHWRPAGVTNGHHLTARQFVNCGRILREAVSNVIRHAQATEIMVCFAIIEDRLQMSVTDNGVIGTEAIVGKGLGMRNMQLRAQALDGEIAWSANTPARHGLRYGLTVTLSFPIQCAEQLQATCLVRDQLPEKVN